MSFKDLSKTTSMTNKSKPAGKPASTSVKTAANAPIKKGLKK